MGESESARLGLKALTPEPRPRSSSWGVSRAPRSAGVWLAIVSYNLRTNAGMRRSNRGLGTRRRQYRQPRGVEARSEVVAEAQAGVEVGVGVEAVVI